MIVVFSVVIPAFLAGSSAALLARRWPRLDAAAPRLDAASPLVRKEVRQRPRLRAFLRRDIDPAVATSITLVAGVAAVLVFAVCVGVLLIMVQTDSGLAKWDLALARWGAEHATPGSTSALRHISLLGGTAGVIAIALVAGTVEYIRRPNRAIPALLALTVLGQFAISNIVKVVVSRDRPSISQLTGFSGASFPSGHAAAAAATFAVVGLLVGRGRSRNTRNAIAGLAIGIAMLVAMSRVMLGVHWLTDVLAGLALGWGWLAACSIAFGGRLLRFGSPVEAARDLTQEVGQPVRTGLRAPLMRSTGAKASAAWTSIPIQRRGRRGR